MTKYPYWIGRLLGLFSYFGLNVPGAIRRMTCTNCKAKNIEQEACTNLHSPVWVSWEAISAHRASCGLPCASGISTELLLSELKSR